VVNLKFLFVAFLLLPQISFAQNAVSIEVKGGGLAPLNPFKGKSSNRQFIDDGGATAKYSFGLGLGLNFVYRGKFVFYSTYSYYKVNLRNNSFDYDGLFNKRPSPNPQLYSTDRLKYWYLVRLERIQIHNPKVAFGYVFEIKNFVLVPKANIGVIIYIPPKLSVDEYLYDSTFTGRIGQRAPSFFLSTIESFKPKPTYAFSYGVDFSVGYKIYKGLIASVFAEYTGSSNINYSYFPNYQFGYSKSIQQITYGLKLEYAIQLKAQRASKREVVK